MRYLTKQGYKKLKKELQELKEERKNVAERIRKAKEMGDVSENAGYEKAKEDQGFLEGKIQRVKGILKDAEVVSKREGGKIGIGSNIVVQANGTKASYQLVGEGESDPSQGKISYSSPIGKQFMGKRKGDKVEVTTPEGKKVYRIVKVE